MEQMKSLLDQMEKLSSEVNVDAVFGSPEKYDDHVIIPVAEISYGYGIGFGSADDRCCSEDCCSKEEEACCEKHAEDATDDEMTDQTGGAVGGGGGIGAKARPIAYIEIGPDGTKVKAIVDEQKVALMGIALSIWAVGWIGLVLKTIFSPRK
ncbi:MAG: spore germination protein GerW family protein [Anaerolineae bacterium]|nr:spore germination protein GerW family protein [Anaerolineae bacterium]